MPTEPVTFRWGYYGAMIGVLALISEPIWSGDTSFAPWSGYGIGHNLGMIAGSMVVPAFIGLIAGAIRDRTARRTGRMT